MIFVPDAADIVHGEFVVMWKNRAKLNIQEICNTALSHQIRACTVLLFSSQTCCKCLQFRMVPYGAVWYNAVWLAVPTVETFVPQKNRFVYIFPKKQLIKFETNNAGVCGMPQKVG